jgi:hypothetical protein
VATFTTSPAVGGHSITAQQRRRATAARGGARETGTRSPRRRR